MLLTGDIGFTVFEEFRKMLPNQFINVGVAEANMIGLATGLSLSGKIPFVYSIAPFVTLRPLEQIKLDVSLHRANVKIVGSGAGLSYSNAGPTHHAVEDIALMRTMLHMTILCPADPAEASWATKQAVIRKGPFYLRLGKKGEPRIHTNKQTFTLGKGIVLREGKHVAILATGTSVIHALLAAKLLEKKNMSATVVSMHTIKPLDVLLVKQLAKSHRYIVTVEEHFMHGGLGSAVAEVLSGEEVVTKLLRMGIPDQFITEAGSHDHHRKRLSIDAIGIAKGTQKFLYG